MRTRSLLVSALTILSSVGFIAMPQVANAAACSGATDFTSTGDGSVGDPYEIASASDLIYLSQNQATAGLLAANYLQTANIDLAQCDFLPIGAFAPFNGSYSGNAKTISGLKVSGSSAELGLFGKLAGSVSRLGIVGGQISGTADRVGMLAGQIVEGAMITESYVTGSVTGDEHVGGLVGDAAAGSVTNSWSSASVTGTAAVGGFAGTRNSATLETNYSSGLVTATGAKGGFVGSQVLAMVSVTNNFYNSTTAGTSSSAIGLGLTAENFRVRANFTGFDFSTPIWRIDGNANAGAPYLALQNVVPEVASTVGTDFWTTFGRTGQASSRIELFLSSTLDSDVTITFPSGVTQAVALEAGVTKAVDITTALGANTNTIQEGTTSNGVRIQSNNPISVYGLDWINASTDAWTAIPTASLGYSYMANIPSSGDSAQGSASNLQIVATEPGTTTVTITPTVALAGARSAGTPFNVTLTRGQVYKTTVATRTADISGTKVTADRKIAVINSSFFASTPQGTTGAYDQTFEQLIPVETWGTEYLVARGATSAQADTLKVVAKDDGTVVLRNGSPVSYLDAGEAQQFAATNTGARADLITANKPISLTHVTTGNGNYNFGGVSASGDPAVAAVPAINQYLNAYVITTPAANFPINFATVIVKQSEKALVTKGGYAIGASQFTDIPGTAHAVARVFLTLGTHYFRAPSGFLLQIAGYGNTDSYSYPGGMGLVDPVAYPNGVPQLEALQSPTKPVSVGGDAISGAPNVCSILSVTEGSWLDGRSAILSTTYQWLRNGLPISGANANTLSLAGFSAGDLISYEIRKTNALGSTSAFSLPVRVVDNLLVSLDTSVGTLSPAFDPCVTSYTINVIQDWVSITATAPSDVAIALGSSGLLSGQGSAAQALTLGVNTRTVTSTRSGITQTYTLTINYSSGPTVAMQAVTALAGTTATLNASVNAFGNALSSAEFDYATLDDFSNSITTNATYSTATGAQNISKPITGLTGGQRYFVRARVTNSAGTVVSQTFEFTTLAAPSISSINAVRDGTVETELDLSALINPNGSSAQLIVRYSLASDFSNAQELNIGAAALGTNATSRSGTIAGLPKGALVHYQLRVTNAFGTNFGPVSSFQMKAKASFGNPDITVGATTATIDFPVNPHSAVTDMLCISYSTSANVNPSCPSYSIPSPSVIDGNEFVTARVVYTGLNPSTTYYIIALARNKPIFSNELSYSSVHSFTTAPAAALTSSLEGPAAVGPNDAILVTFRFSGAISGFDKTKVALSGSTNGWTTQQTYEVEPGLYIMEIRPTGTVTAPSTLTIGSAAPGVSAAGVAFPVPTPINVAVVNSAPAISYAGSPFNLNQYQAIAPASATNSGGVAATFTVSPALPAGLSISNSGVISGTPVSAQSATNYTVTATNAAGSGSTTISIAVTASSLLAPTIDYPQSTYSFLRGNLITPLTPTLGGGAATSISVFPSLPAGLSLDGATGVISGTPTMFSTARNYIVSATNGAGSDSFTIRLGTFEQGPSVTYSAGPFQFPQFTAGGSGAPTNSGGAAFFSVQSGTLPTGLSINSSTGEISGTPTGTRLSANANVVNVTVRASNSAGFQDITLSVQVMAIAPVVTYTNTIVTVGSSISTASPSVSATGGAVTSYSISPALPAGLTMSSTGVITGAPSVIPASPNFVITVSNSAGTTTANWSLTVNNRTPSFAYVGSPYVGNEQQVFTSGAPNVTGGVGITFTVSPALPNGLSINSTTGAITGTPAVGSVQAATNYTVTGTNSSGVLTRVVSIRITNLPVLAFSYPNPTVNITETAAIATQAPTVAAGSPTQFSIAPALPAGLVLSASTGEITGTPARGTRQAQTSYLITGTDGTGSNSFQVSLEITPKPILFSYGPGILSLEENLASTPASPQAASGSILPLTFSVAPALPAGLTLDPVTGIVSGTPAVGTEQVATTYTITGVDGALVETFSLDIEIAAEVIQQVVQTPSDSDSSYFGPLVTALSKRLANPGDSMVAFGSRLSYVSHLEIGGFRVEVVELTDSRFAFDLPKGLAAGRYDLVLYSSFGKLTVQNAFEVNAAASSFSRGFWTKKISSNQVKIYGKSLVGVGKVQFLVNGLEVAWIRAVSSSDRKIVRAGAGDYLIRTRDLGAGKNRFEIRLNEKRIWFATYKK